MILQMSFATQSIADEIPLNPEESTATCTVYAASYRQIYGFGLT